MKILESLFQPKEWYSSISNNDAVSEEIETYEYESESEHNDPGDYEQSA